MPCKIVTRDDTLSTRIDIALPPNERQRAAFGRDELAIVLSHYDLGIIESITEFPRGSRSSPKVGVVCERGKYVLKRRAAIRAKPDRVRFAHLLQAHLTASGYPAPRLVPSRGNGDTAMQIRSAVYELFEFVAGHVYSKSIDETRDAGLWLARLHTTTDSFVVPEGLRAPFGDYHDSAGVRTGLCGIGSTLASHDSFSGDEAELATLVQSLLESYDLAAEAADDYGLGDLPMRVIHADWHPGNLLFRNDRVLAVIDYDSARRSRGIIDVANGALQFSMRGSKDPATWPSEVAEERFHAFLEGYQSVRPLSDDERRCLPHLMAEALVTECVAPIVQTGSVGRWTGFRVLKMVRRKLAWLAENGDRIIDRGAD